MNVADLFKKRLFPDFTLVAGNLGLGREISSVTVMDSPDIDKWLRGGEFIIGNGFIFRDTPEEFGPFLERVSRKSVAAVGMKFGRFHTTLPPSALEVAERLAVPVIDIPIVYRWTDIFDIIYNVLLTEKSAPSSSTYWNADWTLKKSFSDLARTLGRDFLLACPQLDIDVVLYSALGETKEDYALYRILSAARPPEDTASRKTFLSRELFEIGSNPSRGVACYSTTFHSTPVALYLLMNEGEKQPSLRQERLIELAFHLLRTEYLDQSIAMKSKADRQKFFLEHLCTGFFYGGEEIMRSNAAKYGVEIAFPCQVIVTKNTLPRGNHNPPGIRTGYDGREMCVGLSETTAGKEKLQQYAAETSSYIVIGVPARTFSDIAISYKSAVDTLELIQELNLPPDLYEHNRFALFDMLTKAVTSQAAQEIRHTWWHPLTYSPARGCLTLEKFAAALVDSDYNLRQTSDAMHIHYNTARKYAQRLETLLNIDLDNKMYRFAFSMAYYAHLAAHNRDLLLREIQNPNTHSRKTRSFPPEKDHDIEWN